MKIDIDLTVQKKSIDQTLYELGQLFLKKKVVPKAKRGKFKKNMYRLQGWQFFADSVGTSANVLRNYYKNGVNVKNKSFVKKILQAADDFNIKKTFRVIPMYTRNSFTKDGFKARFDVKGYRGKKGYVFLGRLTLWMKFNMGFIIPAFPIAAADKQLKKVVDMLADKIQKVINSKESLLFFQINFLNIGQFKAQKTF